MTIPANAATLLSSAFAKLFEDVDVFDVELAATEVRGRVRRAQADLLRAQLRR